MGLGPGIAGSWIKWVRLGALQTVRDRWRSGDDRFIGEVPLDVGGAFRQGPFKGGGERGFFAVGDHGNAGCWRELLGVTVGR